MAAERRGTPALGVMTETFVDAAKAMAGALGDAAYGFAVIPHPVSSATDAGLRARAEATLYQLRAQLRTSGGNA
jgi:hypothetical protein